MLELNLLPLFERICFLLCCSLSRSLSLLNRNRQVARAGIPAPEVTIEVAEKGKRSEVFRTLPAVLGTPSLGHYLPTSLAEFAEVFRPDQRPSFSVEKLALGGPGASTYGRFCDFQILRPAR